MSRNPESPASVALEAFVRNAASALSAVGFQNEAGLVAMVKKRAPSPVGQKTINNALKGRHDGKVSTYDAIASGLGIPLWVLFIPELQPSDLQSPEREQLVSLVQNYLKCKPEGRHQTAQMASVFAAKAKAEK